MNFKLKRTIALTLITVSCVTYQNDYGRKRFNRCKFIMKRNTNNEVYKIIDTNVNSLNPKKAFLACL
ncbi:hypothetical protein FBALC1_16892 [Flavobacteriales bacterium ALC-1]|nr:hypothetical protein FBALC1_16892 [Flavobacteriales bacterium ALC-1]